MNALSDMTIFMPTQHRVILGFFLGLIFIAHTFVQHAMLYCINP
jgi:hypothetical protein